MAGMLETLHALTHLIPTVNLMELDVILSICAKEECEAER